jgi:hypothetical protein
LEGREEFGMDEAGLLIAQLVGGIAGEEELLVSGGMIS